MVTGELLAIIGVVVMFLFFFLACSASVSDRLLARMTVRRVRLIVAGAWSGFFLMVFGVVLEMVAGL